MLLEKTTFMWKDCLVSRIKKVFDIIEKEWSYLQSNRDDSHSITVKDYPFDIGGNDIMLGVDAQHLSMLLRMDENHSEKDAISLLDGLAYKIHNLTINN